MEGNAAPTKAPDTAQRKRRPSEAPEKRTAQDLARALTKTSWLPGDELRLSEWIEHGRRLGVIGRGVGWWIGDWLRYGNMKFGERYVRASRITGYDVQTLMNMVYVATAYDDTQRRGSLSWSHHAELAALPAGERDRWLDQAERERLSVRCLREELRRERRLEAGQAPEPAAEPAAIAAGADAAAPDGPAESSGVEHGGVAAAAAAPDVRCPQCGCRIADEPAAPAPLRVA
ncbi:MAG TPA: hypothetical protein VF517_11655 [Thermoleophilaceae bacterium]|jgi:hypothetical protein